MIIEVKQSASLWHCLIFVATWTHVSAWVHLYIFIYCSKLTFFDTPDFSTHTHLLLFTLPSFMYLLKAVQTDNSVWVVILQRIQSVHKK